MLPAEATWSALLRQGREGSRLSRRELAEVSGVSEHSLYAYESGRRSPSRDVVLRLSWAMQLDAATTNVILDAFGHEPEPSDWARLISGLPPLGRQWQGVDVVEEAQRVDALTGDVLAARPWPSLVLNARCEVLACNQALERVTGLQCASAQPGTALLSIVGWIVSDHFRTQVANWDEVVSALLPGVLKREIVRTGEAAGSDGPRTSLQEQLGEAHEILQHLRQLWEASPLVALGERVAVPLVWRHDDGTALAFTCIVSVWNHYLGYWAIDWHPADAATWEWLRAASP